MLEVKIKQHGYQGNIVLKEIHHTFGENQIHGILGPNGSGKSTLLKLLTAIERPVEGTVFFKGKELLGTDESIACCWQKPYLFQGTVKYNLEYPMKIRQWSREKRAQRVQELITEYHLEPLLNRNVRGLSGGEAARVSIARAVAAHPQVLVLDEPSAALDPQNVIFVESLLKRLRDSSNLTIIMVTHNMFQAKRIADQTIYIEDGRIVEAGDTQLIFSNPEHEKTRQFITGEYIY